MFSINSKIFISCESITRNASIDEIDKLIKKRKNPYVLSFHNGFKNFDYTQIEEIKILPSPRDIYSLTFVNPLGVEYEILIDGSHRIYTDIRGYVPAFKVNDRDIFIDVCNNKCKLINSEKVRVDEEFIAIESKYNRSLCCNNVLMRDS